MIVLFALVGLLVGWLVDHLSTALPRLTRHAVNTQPPMRVPALVSLLSSRQLSTPQQRLALGIEIISIAVFAGLAAAYGWSWKSLLLASAYTFFALIALIDLKVRLVPNLLIYPAILVTLVMQITVGEHALLSVALGAGLTFGMFWLAAILKPGGIGGGDLKLAALIGLLFGFPQVLWALIVGVGLGGVVAVWMLSRGKHAKATIPYAPFLCVGSVIALLYTPIVFMK